MKFFHLSDLHIGLKLMNRDLLEDQRYIFRQVAALAEKEQPDAIVIAGDIYDKAVPSADAVGLFDELIVGLRVAVPKAAIMLISGNHDSAPRVNCFRSVLCAQNLYMIGMPPQTEADQIAQVILEDACGPVHFYLLPFVRPSMVKSILGTDENGVNFSYDETVRRLLARESINTTERNVLVTHQFYLPAGKQAEEIERMDSETRTVGNIDQIRTDMLEPFDYVAMGHIHKPMQVGAKQYVYCGTPLACSVSEAGQEKGIRMVELKEKGAEPKLTVLPLVPLRQVRVVKGSLTEVLQQACEDYVTVILTDRVDLDVIDLQERLHAAFPYLLEIRREGLRTVSYERQQTEEAVRDPYELCSGFFQELDEEEERLLRDVLQTVQEVK